MYSGRELNNWVKQYYSELKDGIHKVKISNSRFRCPFCFRHDYKYFEDLLSHARNIPDSSGNNLRAQHLALGRYMTNYLRPQERPHVSSRPKEELAGNWIAGTSSIVKSSSRRIAEAGLKSVSRGDDHGPSIEERPIFSTKRNSSLSNQDNTYPSKRACLSAGAKERGETVLQIGLDPLKPAPDDDLLVHPWTVILANVSRTFNKTTRMYESASGSGLKAEIGRLGFTPKKFELVWNGTSGSTGFALVQFNGNWIGFENAIMFDKHFAAKQCGKTHYFDSGNRCSDKLYGWIAKKEDFDSYSTVGSRLRKIGDLTTVSGRMEEEKRKSMTLARSLQNTLETKSSVEKICQDEPALKEEVEGASCDEASTAVVDRHSEDAPALATEAGVSTRDHLTQTDVDHNNHGLTSIHPELSLPRVMSLPTVLVVAGKESVSSSLTILNHEAAGKRKANNEVCQDDEDALDEPESPSKRLLGRGSTDNPSPNVINPENDELAESASGKLLEKFANPSSSVSPVLQPQCIQNLCQDEPALKEEVEGASCDEASTAVVDRHSEDAPALATEAGVSTRDHLTETDVDHNNHGLTSIHPELSLPRVMSLPTVLVVAGKESVSSSLTILNHEAAGKRKANNEVCQDDEDALDEPESPSKRLLGRGSTDNPSPNVINPENDELAESASGKLLEKFANPSSSVSPVLQPQCIQNLCQDEPALKEEVEGASCDEASTAVVDRHCEDAPALATEAGVSTRDHLTETDVDHNNHGLTSIHPELSLPRVMSLPTVLVVAGKESVSSSLTILNHEAAGKRKANNEVCQDDEDALDEPESPSKRLLGRGSTDNPSPNVINPENDELAESASGKLLEKFANPSSSVSPVLQPQCIQNLCQDEPALKEEVEGASCDEASTAVVDRHSEDAPALATEAGVSTRDHLTETDVDHNHHGLTFGLNTEDHIKERDVDHGNQGLMFGLEAEGRIKKTDGDHGLESFSCQPSARSLYAETSSYSQHQLNSPLSDSSSSPERTDMMSAIDEASGSESDKDLMAEHCSDDMEKMDRNTAVIMIPEYVVLKDTPCAAYLVIFSCNGIKMKSYLDNNEEVPSSCEFGVEDIVSIQYNRYQNVGLISLRIRVLLKDEQSHEYMQNTTGIKELKFAVKDHNWPEKQQQINSLHVRYPVVWSADLEYDDDVEVSGDNLHQRKPYFPRFDGPFEDVIYPKGDPDAVSICKSDVDLLQPETFLNDTIIDFYINYLKNQIQEEDRQRFHFFNSFFFRKLADLDKYPSSIADGKAAFLRVRKWTRKVDMFGKDYIFVPVNFNLHWTLIIICHPGEVANCTDLDLDDSPCILHMDSMKGIHTGLKNLVQSYLCEEWKERHKDTSDDISSRFMNLRFVSLELPQQENSYDCGLFLLHYLELFLAEGPQNFSISNASNFLYLNWFAPAEASLKRTLIEKLIFELLENRSREVIDEQNQSCESPVPVNDNTGIEVLSGRCTPLVDCNGNIKQTQDEQGIEMTLLERSSMRNVQAVNDYGMVLRDLFDAGVNNTGSFLGQLQQTLEEPASFYHLSNNSLATEHVEMESGEQFMCRNSGEGTFQRITGTASPRASVSFSSLNPSMMPVVQKEGEAGSLSEASNGSENIHGGETGESPTRVAVSLFSATLGPSTDHNSDNAELASSQDKLVVAESQDGRDEEKQLENDLGIGDKTSEDLEIDNKTSGDLGTKEKTGGDIGTEGKTNGDPGIVDKTSDVLVAESEDVGDDCDHKEEPMEEEDEKRAAKRSRLSSTGEVEEMETNL